MSLFSWFLQLIFSIICFALVADGAGYSKIDFTVSSSDIGELHLVECMVSVEGWFYRNLKKTQN
jgi:hypothetical protein